ncbi:uracil-DNA glycosylase family protein [Cellulosilyticum ruminicola]|uniref:uracil-DNA glycosylase family protein n=1 Tax=Cellulosilyticum ruminicola TaxID=425254 RepID=UPI0006CF7852|nr:hypothetical protein [Cellulosilyticum ruminicola]
MKQMPKIKDYYNEIAKLPLKKTYTKEELIVPEFCIEEEGNISIYYNTHNEYMNPNGKVFIVGITPGFAQMNTSIIAARKCIEEGVPLEEMPYICKKEARFSGTLRKNIIEMLDELNVQEALGICSTAELFGDRDDLLHTTSMLPFATFVKGKNYTGHTPDLMKNELLMDYVKAFFYPQVEMLKDAFIIPLGRCVENIVLECIQEGKLKESQCLLGFPHPSGANVNRKKQFEAEKQQMQEKIEQFFK